jgi:hypothetical protein
MSQLPPPYDPLPYASAGMRVPAPRATSVTVIAVIAIISGALGVLGDTLQLRHSLNCLQSNLGI